MAEDEEGEPRADETLGIDRSEQPGLGGDSSVLEEYGEDTVRDDLPERPDVPLEAPLPGTDPDLPTDLAVADGGADPNLPLPGHELKPGISKAGDAPLKRPQDLRQSIEAGQAEEARQGGERLAGASGNVE